VNPSKTARKTKDQGEASVADRPDSQSFEKAINSVKNQSGRLHAKNKHYDFFLLFYLLFFIISQRATFRFRRYHYLRHHHHHHHRE